VPTYRGSCHCGRIQFEVDATPSRLSQCNCSICRAKGAIYLPVREVSSVRILSGANETRVYRFHTRNAQHHFCPVCGIHTFHRPRIAPERWSVNARCLHDFDLASLPLVTFDGRNWERAAQRERDGAPDQEAALQLAEVERALDANTYRPGAWERFLAAASSLPPDELAPLAEAVTRVSDKLHRRKGERRFGFERLLAAEILAALAGLLLLAAGAAFGSAALLVVSAALLGSALQPLLKVAAGLALGLGYSYGYLWRGEPRFKLAYGRYLALPGPRRVIFHLAGTLGSLLAWLLVAVVSLPRHPLLSRVLLWLLAAHLVFQTSLFLLALAGRRRLPGLGLLRLTSAGAAGDELRRLRARRAPAPSGSTRS
jgi:hypothetical protein